MGNKASLCEVTTIKKVDQATVSGLSSASDGPGIVLFDKEVGCPGNFIALLDFRAQADAAAVLKDPIAMVRKENKSIIFHPRSRMS